MSDTVKGTVIPKFDAKDVEEYRVVAALSYLSFLFLIPLLAARKSRFAQEHAKQGLILFVVWVIGLFFFWIPLFGWLALVVVFAANLIAFIRCLSGEFWEIPIIGQYRAKINL